ncbi:glycosyltransferase family 2 protein [Mastigocladopsis repens]|uniref:glycosyltransferase family 2 protein n=1 Tax=Mastigocladopsis repens TaxID=221287 RepID=UPI00035E3AC4|nr:glycosyltransferase family A protein [Mastigocladopsis repens]
MQTASPLVLVSVIIPAYNAEAFIGRTLKSVLSQTYTNVEVLVVDDGSQDTTAEIVKSFAQQDERVTLLQQKNAGVAAARNLAIEKSRGEYIAPIDADDIWYPQKLEKQVQSMLEADLSVGLVYAWSVDIDEEDAIIGKYNLHYNLNFQSVEGNVYPAMLYSNIIGNGSVPLIRRTCFEKVGGYNSKLREQNAQGCEDWDIYLRIAEYYQFRAVPEFLIGYRQVSGSMSRNCTAMERSYNLVMADARQRRPETSSRIYNWSASNFYIYMLSIGRACGDYWSTLAWLYKAIKLDYSPLLKSSVYKCFIICLFKISAKYLISLIWSEEQSRLQFPKKIQSSKKVAINGVNTVSESQKEIYKIQYFPWQPYELIKWQRWLYIVQLCQTVSH